MRKRNLIPAEHKKWLETYLERKDIKNYPELDAIQWRMLQGAYRQMLLKSKSVSNSLSGKKLFNRNMALVAERDKATTELRTVKNIILSKERIIEQQKQDIDLLKKQLRQSTRQVLGSGIYDGTIPLSIAVKLLASAPKDSAKQSILRQNAIKACGYISITERKLSQSQKVKVYNHIVTLCKNN